MKIKAFTSFLISAISVFMLAACESTVPADTMTSHTISYTADILGKIETGADVSETEPFTITLNLPSEWTTGELTTEKEGYPPYTVIFDENGENSGLIQFCTYVPDKELSSNENYHQYVFNQLMLGSFVNWGTDYTPVKEGKDFCNAVCTIMTDKHDGSDIQYEQGILAYNDTLGVYTNICFNTEIPDEIHKAVAESIVFTECN